MFCYFLVPTTVIYSEPYVMHLIRVDVNTAQSWK